MSDTITPPKQQRKPLHQLIPKLVFTSAIFWLPMLVFLYLANQIRENHTLPGDISVLESLHRLSNPFMDKLAVLITTMGSAAVVVIGVIIAAVILEYKHHRRQAVFLLFTTAGTAAIDLVLKLIFHRARPELWPRIVTENDYSFPSGHSMISSALAFSFIILCWNTRYRWWAVVGGTAYFISVGFSRLYLGVHYPSDVLGGWTVSLLWVLAVHYAFGRFGKRKSSASNTSEIDTADNSSIK